MSSHINESILNDEIKEHLKENGEVWLVVRKQQGAESLMRDMKKIYNSVEVIKKKKGFYIIRSKEK